MSTCRDEVLVAFERLESRHGREVFTHDEIVTETLSVTAEFSENTIRTHVASRMCVDAPAHHAVRYPDLERVDRGRYRRFPPISRAGRSASRS